ncbi:PerC family transcriptional regulator [Cedecea davisae]|uniref:PerC family transcriptional regulator n=1 Tax=Cedecea davisae TaxID=158484 RepID=UPI00376ECE48
MTISLKTKLEKYHANYVSRRQSAIVATSPEAIRLEARARELEHGGKFRLAARQWLAVFDAASGDVERARIAMRRDQCITLSNTRRFSEAAYEMAGRFIG